MLQLCKQYHFLWIDKGLKEKFTQKLKEFCLISPQPHAHKKSGEVL